MESGIPDGVLSKIIVVEDGVRELWKKRRRCKLPPRHCSTPFPRQSKPRKAPLLNAEATKILSSSVEPCGNIKVSKAKM
jgi:hypothetical protein